MKTSRLFYARNELKHTDTVRTCNQHKSKVCLSGIISITSEHGKLAANVDTAQVKPIPWISASAVIAILCLSENANKALLQKFMKILLTTEKCKSIITICYI